MRPRRRPHAARCLLLLAAAASATSATASGREALSLDGGGWTLTLDPGNPATARLRAAGRKTNGPITVPGAWEAQGFGEETTQMEHQYIGAAVYARTVALPAGFGGGPGATVWLVAERIQRAAKVTAGSGPAVVVGEHIGYLSPLELDVTKAIGKDRALALAIEVNATRRLNVDGLQGEEDLETDGTGLGGWGGIGGHVRLEARGPGWIVAPHVQHELASPGLGSAVVNVSIEVGGHEASGTGFKLRVSYRDPANQPVAGHGGPAVITADCPDLGLYCSVPSIRIPDPQLWSPRTPQQYSATIELVGASGAVLDAQLIKFGLRKLELIGYHWKLNGVWLYLHGYGDDSIYPMSTSPPLNFSFYEERLEFSHGLGMNFVRHHSHILPIEYFDAACEVGVMISAEFPIAYGKPRSCVHGGCDPLYKHEWISIIKQIRNHPCVFDYTMDNEDIGLDIAADLYKTAKQLDPSRLVNTADGVWPDPGTCCPYTDFQSHGFALNTIPILDPHQFAVASTPKSPVIDHEMGNFVSWPLLEDQISRFHHTIKPYWLTPPLAAVTAHGLLAENALWSARSNRLFLYCWKDKLEVRRLHAL